MQDDISQKALTNKQNKKLGRQLELYLRSFGNGELVQKIMSMRGKLHEKAFT